MRVRVDGIVHEGSTTCRPPRQEPPPRHQVVVDRVRCARICAAASPNPSRPPSPTPRARHRRRDGQRREPCSPPVRLPGVRLRAGRAGTAPVLLQQPDGRLPRATAWARWISSTRCGSSCTPTCPLASGAIRGWDRRQPVLFPSSSPASPTTTNSTWTTFGALPATIRDVVLRLSGARRIAFRYLSDGGKPVTQKHASKGIIPSLERRYRNRLGGRPELAKYRATCACPPATARGLPAPGALRADRRTATCPKSAACPLARLPRPSSTAWRSPANAARSLVKNRQRDFSARLQF